MPRRRRRRRRRSRTTCSSWGWGLVLWWHGVALSYVPSILGIPNSRGHAKSMGVRIPNSRGHAKVAVRIPPNAGSSLSNQRHLYRASSCECGAQRMDGLMKGKQRGTPTSSGSNIAPAFLLITTWAKLFNMFVAFPSSQLKGPHRSVGAHHLSSRGHTEVWESITPTQALRVVVLVLVDNWAPSAPIDSLCRYL